LCASEPPLLFYFDHFQVHRRYPRRHCCATLCLS
jgi:hypothetical protein